MRRWAGPLSVVAAVIATVLLGVPSFVQFAILIAAGLLAFFHKRWVALTSVVMLTILVGSCHVGRKLTWVNYKVPVTYPPPAEFPVLIVGKTASGDSEPNIVLFEELEPATKRFVSWSFLVPESGVTAKVKGFVVGGYELFSPEYEMTKLGPGRQRFKVHGSPDSDADNTGWYVAEDHQIFPEFYERYGPNDQTASCMTGPFVFIIWLALAAAIIKYVADRQGRVTAPPPR
ncbi:MAG: hypothetical protein M3041_20440 [Acidobacteriota bacterium]|nr:hypothetical protein [Acidobacteriota bacterium]